MARGYYRETVRLLSRHGYVYIGNAKGSHEKWEHPETGVRVTVPYHLSKRHLANYIMKSAGIAKRF